MSLTFSAQQNTFNTTTGDKMKIGDLVRCIYTDEVLVITSVEVDGYFDVYAVGTGSSWLMPKEHLEVIK